MKFNSKYAGQYYQMQGGEVYVLRGDGKFAYASADIENIIAVQLTGFYMIGANGKAMYQTTTDGWVDLSAGWQNTGYAPIRQYTAKDAEYYVNKVIKNNARILENNLVCAAFANKLTEDQQTTLYSLQMRMQSRNQRILDDGLCSNIKVSTPPGYSLLDNALANFMNAYANGAPITGGIGLVVSTTVVIVVSCIVVASMATAAYFAYKAFAAESEKDVQYSDELTRTLMEKLTPEEYEQLKNETQGIVTKSRLASRLSGWGDMAKFSLLALGGLLVYKLIKDKRKGNNV